MSRSTSDSVTIGKAIRCVSDVVLEDLVSEQQLNECATRLPLVQRTARLVVALQKLRSDEVHQFLSPTSLVHSLQP